MANQTSNPSPEQLNDPEGQQLVQTIHERKELTGTLANTICNASNYPKRAQPHLLGSDMSHVINKTADSLLAAGYAKPRTVTTFEALEALLQDLNYEHGVDHTAILSEGILYSAFCSDPDGAWILETGDPRERMECDDPHGEAVYVPLGLGHIKNCENFTILYYPEAAK